MWGRLTVTASDAASEPSLEVLTEALFVMSPQSAAVVVASTWTVEKLWAARVVGEKTRLPAMIDQPVEAGLMVQPPLTAGRASVKLTPLASPSPLLDTVTVKPIWSP